MQQLQNAFGRHLQQIAPRTHKNYEHKRFKLKIAWHSLSHFSSLCSCSCPNLMLLPVLPVLPVLPAIAACPPCHLELISDEKRNGM